jgi:hypothetical protein
MGIVPASEKQTSPGMAATNSLIGDQCINKSHFTASAARASFT